MRLIPIASNAFRDFLISASLLISACRKSDGVTKAAINEKRKLSANLAVTRAHLSLKAREGAIVWLCRSVALFIRISVCSLMARYILYHTHCCKISHCDVTMAHDDVTAAHRDITATHLDVCVLFADVESRAKYDTEQKLKTNQAEQKALNEVALQQDLDLKQKKIEQKITVSSLQ